MKPNRTNSFRLHRVSRASSLKKHSQTFYQADETFKLSAINSVTQGIRHSQLSFITGDDLQKLRVEPIVPNDYMYDAAHQSLADVRRKYDQMKKNRVDVEENIARLKADILKYRTIENEYQSKKENGNFTVKGIEKELQDKALLLEETIMQKKVLISMQRRLKKDKVVYDQRKFDLEKEFQFQKKQIQIFREDGYFAGEEQDRTTKIYQRFMNQLQSQRNQRQKHLENLQAMISQKQESNINNSQRQQQIFQIAQRALQDKNPDQKQWHQIYLTNVFVSRLLRTKIEKEMQKFQVVQHAFKNIKTSTGVSDCKTMVQKFLNKEDQYGNLLGRITINQKRISQLKEHRDFLLEEQKELEMEKETLANSKTQSVDISNEIKRFSQVSDQERRIETHLSKISTWLNKQTKKMSAIEKTSVAFKDTKNKNSVKQNFIQFCQIIDSLVDKCNQNKGYKSAECVTPSDLSARDSARVARVAPRKSRKNTYGEQVFDFEEEELNPTNENEERDMLNMQRDELVKTNEKFMREARKRFQERRKKFADKDKKDKKFYQIKKEED